LSVSNLTNVAASVKGRLLNIARKSNRQFDQLLRYYAMERFLYRLSMSQYNRDFLLKGSLMLRSFGAELSRPTMDIDLLGKTSNDKIVLRKMAEDCCAIVVDDGIVFDTTDMTLQNIVEGADYHGVRVRFSARLGPARIPMQIDIGFGDKVVPAPVWIDLPQILDFGTPHLRACTAETAIAEKLHAAVSREAINSRMKDFYDIYMMGSHLAFEGYNLASAIKATFDNRETPIDTIAPLALTPDFACLPGKKEQWNAFIRKLQLDNPPSLEEAVMFMAGFLLPVLKSIASDNSFSNHWNPGGPWS
jgi:predicted nucleotidyltransferase component of viral defense system